jgi:flavin-dependent thymidylate synthase
MGSITSEPGNAINLLIFTKSTRLTMHPGLLSEISTWPQARKMQELEYMARTIPSSWEFVDYVFMVENVTRAFTHQLVRTRHGSYAQQTMRVLDVSEGPGWSYGTGPSIPGKAMTEKEHDALDNNDQWLHDHYHNQMESIAGTYKCLIARGAKIEDARGILPTNIHTNIVVKFNMRTLVELVRKRSSPRTQGEYRQFLDQMLAEVRTVHPWIDLFVNRTKDKTLKELDQEIADLEVSQEQRTKLMKLVDMIRQE